MAMHKFQKVSTGAEGAGRPVTSAVLLVTKRSEVESSIGDVILKFKL